MFKNFNHNNLSKEVIFFLFLYFTLLISFFLGENSTGGAFLDYINQKKISIKFSEEFFDSLINYDEFSTRHSPILIIFLSFFEKLNFSDILIRLIHFHLCLLLPIYFFKSLQLKFLETDKIVLILLTSLIFISPTFRSLSIWPDSRIFGLIFFTISVYNYLKFQKYKKFKFCVLNTIALAISAYISPNFSVFAIYFFFKFILYYKINSREIFKIIILNIFLSLPAIFYIFYLKVNFLTETAAIGLNKNENIFFNNIFNDILITFSLLFFYFFPFLVTKIIKSEKILKIENLILSIFIFLLCLLNFNYNFKYSGGGIFLQTSNLIFLNNYFFYLISLFSILIVLPLLLKDKNNILLFILILLNNPQYTIYHKYFDPFLLISYFTIFTLDVDIKQMKKRSNIFIVFFYFLIFLVISNFKYLWKI